MKRDEKIWKDMARYKKIWEKMWKDMKRAKKIWKDVKEMKRD